jgi:hypothetical protein
MLKKTELRDAAYGYIKTLPVGRIIGHADLYRFLEENFSKECSQRGDAAKEPRYKNDARWAVMDAKRDRLLNTLSLGKFQRTSK